MARTNPSNLKLLAFAGAFSFIAIVCSLAAMLGMGALFALVGATIPFSLGLALGVSGPTVAAILFAARFGTDGALAPLKRLARLPTLPLLALLPAAYASAGIAGAWLSGAPFTFPDAASLMRALIIHFLIVALLEEIGWRGYLTPALLRRTTPFIASMIVGLVWFAWHLPKFGVGPLYVALLFVGCFGHSIILSAMIADDRAGLWGCVIFHASVNLSQVVIDPETSSLDAQYAAFAAAIGLSSVIAIVLRRRRDWFMRAGPAVPEYRRSPIEPWATYR